MTDRIDRLIVGLETDVRDDEIDEIVHALKMVKGVILVEPQVVNFTEKMERFRVRNEIQIDILKMLDTIAGVGQ